MAKSSKLSRSTVAGTSWMSARWFGHDKGINDPSWLLSNVLGDLLIVCIEIAYQLSGGADRRIKKTNATIFFNKVHREITQSNLNDKW